ncbi:TetR/AcrR family transcriptional regulator [Jatrophihabitans sp. DSM 45814]
MFVQPPSGRTSTQTGANINHESAGESTRDAIARVAKEMFADNGFAGTSLRSVARRVGVDPALVIRYFGSKEELFLDTLMPYETFESAIRGPIDEMGIRLVKFVADPAARVRRLGTHAALITAANADDVRDRLRRGTMENVVEPVLRRLKGKNRVLRAHLVAAQLAGLLDVLGVIRDETLLDADVDQLAEIYGKSLQALITP